MLVKDINPGTASSGPTHLVDVNGTLFFAGYDDIHGYELWKSDGTSAGTVMVVDGIPGDLGAGADSTISVNGHLFFVAFTYPYGVEVWKSDGTAAGTVIAADVMPGTYDSFPTQLTVVGPDLYFRAYGASVGTEIWRIPNAATCGNGVVDGTETCDDGNFVNGDGCDSNCTVTGCGNGIVTAGETCDDGNSINTDACTNTCAANVCGDGFRNDVFEECDDGNAVNGDGCDNNCTLTRCGNGIATAGEQCDAGLANGTGPCSLGCAVCGNGVVGAGEECDDGNSIASDGCTNTCTICGNGIVSGLEQCDDGNLNGGDGCEADCRFNPPPTPTATPTHTAAGPPPSTPTLTATLTKTPTQSPPTPTSPPGCRFFAAADLPKPILDGATLDSTVLASGLGSVSNVQVIGLHGLHTFDGDLRFTLSSPSNTSVILINRICGGNDDFNVDVADTAATAIPCPPTDGMMHTPSAPLAGFNGESPNGVWNLQVADLGLGDSGTLLSWGLQICSACGNGTLQAGEQCDDGNVVDGDGCDSNCRFTGCGNGVRTAGEQCDDGNTVAGDCCSPTCQIDADGMSCSDGDDCPNDTCQSGSCQPAICSLRDTVLLPVQPVTATIAAGKLNVIKKLTVKVRNADIDAHTVGLTIDAGDCPPAMADQPDFNSAMPGPQTNVLVPAGATKTATVLLTIRSNDFTSFNFKAPERCTLGIAAHALVPGGSTDPSPWNNSVSVEISVVDKDDVEQTVAHETALRSVHPVTVTIPRGKASALKTIAAVVVNADYRPSVEKPGHLIQVTAVADTPCPGVTLSAADCDGKASGVQNRAMVKGGATKACKLTATVAAAQTTTNNGKSPRRCTFMIDATGPTGRETPPLDATNNITRLTVDVIDKNDF